MFEMGFKVRTHIKKAKNLPTVLCTIKSNIVNDNCTRLKFLYIKRRIFNVNLNIILFQFSKAYRLNNLKPTLYAIHCVIWF